MTSVANERPDVVTPALMTIPAILQNPKSKTQAQVESYAAQQREKAQAQARRHLEEKHGDRSSGVDRRKGEGKRSLRRRENAMLAHNPHAALPSRKDLLPPPPVYTPTFPKASSSAIRATSAPSPALPQSEPLSSEAGKYTLSLKGVRQLLRKRGRRAEQVVQAVENELRSWSGAEGLDDQDRIHGTGFGQPKVIDDSVVDVTPEYSTGYQPESRAPHAQLVELTSAPEGSNRTLPRAFNAASGSSSSHTSTVLESFYTAGGVPSSVAASQRKAIVELVREPGHLVWAVADGFERLIVHLLARYYELLSYSQTLPSALTRDNEMTPCYRITHILLPSQSNPALPTSFNLLTPDNTDIDTDFGGVTSSAESSAMESSSEAESDDKTERGDSTEAESDGEGASLAESGVLVGLPDAESARSFGSIPSRRPYTPSESDDEAWTQVDVSSNTIRAEIASPRTRNLPSALSQRVFRDRQLSGDWVSTDDLGSDAEGDISDNESVSSLMDSLILGTAAAPTRTGYADASSGPTFTPTTEDAAHTTDATSPVPFISRFNLPIDLFPERRAPQPSGAMESSRGKMTFFEYLYG